ncbi:MAG: hypothetical protein ACLGGX_08770 [Bdellovibrionia bacterium]
MKNTVALCLLAFVFLGCASGNCRSQKPLAEPTNKEAVVPTTSLSRVKVYKADGSLQCGMGKAIPASEMAKELKNIKIYSSENKNDGQMRIQVCGSPTGQANVYEIDRADLEKALALGFREWTFE